MFTIIKFCENIYLLKDRADCYSTLIIGNKSALLWDTGCGIDDLKSTVLSITDLPLTIICSHGHFDHIGGSFQFDKVYLHKNDRIILESYNENLLNEWLDEIDKDNKHHLKFNNWNHIIDLDFDEIDLGDLSCQIVYLSGHSKGSIGIYIPKLKALFSGDALTPIMTLLFLNHDGLEVQANTLKYVNTLDFDYFFTSHSDKKMPKKLIKRMIHCLENCQGKRFHSYVYPRPPHSQGWFYLDSLEDEPVGVIVENI